MLEVGGGGVASYQPSVIRTETTSFWRLKSLSFEGHLEKKWSICLVIKCWDRKATERVYAGGKDAEGVEDGPDSADMEEHRGCA